MYIGIDIDTLLCNGRAVAYEPQVRWGIDERDVNIDIEGMKELSIKLKKLLDEGISNVMKK